MRGRSIWNRWVLFALLCLGFGAVVNFGVGWWCVRWYEKAGGSAFAGVGAAWNGFSSSGPRPEYYMDLGPTAWSVRVPSDWPRVSSFGQRKSFTG